MTIKQKVHWALLNIYQEWGPGVENVKYTKYKTKPPTFRISISLGNPNILKVTGNSEHNIQSFNLVLEKISSVKHLKVKWGSLWFVAIRGCFKNLEHKWGCEKQVGIRNFRSKKKNISDGKEMWANFPPRGDWKSVGKLRDRIWLKGLHRFQAGWLCLPPSRIQETFVKYMIKALKDGLMSHYDTWLFSLYFSSWRWLLMWLKLNVES